MDLVEANMDKMPCEWFILTAKVNQNFKIPQFYELQI